MEVAVKWCCREDGLDFFSFLFAEQMIVRGWNEAGSLRVIREALKNAEVVKVKMERGPRDQETNPLYN